MRKTYYVKEVGVVKERDVCRGRGTKAPAAMERNKIRSGISNSTENT